MDRTYHEIIPILVLDQLPELRKLFHDQDYPDKRIMEDAVRPDAEYHDSLAQHAEAHFAHSYKQKIERGVIKWDKGDCIERVKAVAIDVVNWYRSGDLELVCRGLGEWSHYCIDCHTYPHIGTSGRPWSTYHMQWEMAQAKWLKAYHHEIGLLHFTPVKDLYKAAVADARRMFPISMAVAAAIQKGTIGSIGMTSDGCLALARRIAEAVGSGWLTIMQQFKCEP